MLQKITMIITIIGIGLIGGSLAITLKENGFAHTVIGVDMNEESLHKALRRKIIDEALPLEQAIEKSQLIILAVPVDSLLVLIPRVLDIITHQVVIDVGSTKVTIMNAIKSHTKRRHFVATHPMAGTEFSGIEAAIPNLFDEKYTVICDVEDSAPAAVALVEQLYQSIPMKIIYLNAKDHDVHTAYVSHISHISSFALALTVLEKEKDEERIFELASTGFSSTVRLAKSAPDTWIPIFRQNRDNLLDVLDEHINTLSQFRSLLIKRDFDKIRKLMEEANHIKRILNQKKV
jgi:prephenate dehydrogenase